LRAIPFHPPLAGKQTRSAAANDQATSELQTGTHAIETMTSQVTSLEGLPGF